jgi:streptomycin 6-kinase
VRTADEEPAVLKLVFEDDETEHEHLALQRWGGDGAVRLLRADPRRRALLLERLSHVDLRTIGYLEAAEVVAGFYSRLHVPAPPQLRTITSYVARWTDALAALPRDAPIPHRLVEQALAHARDLAADPASTGTLVHNDLHDENVLAADREPWLVIDPQPMSGDPHSEPAPLLWNRWDEVQARGRVRDDVRSRFHAVVDTAGLDEDRARAWVVVRMVLNAYWSVEDAARLGRPLDEAQKDWITRCVTIVKAVQD